MPKWVCIKTLGQDIKKKKKTKIEQRSAPVSFTWRYNKPSPASWRWWVISFRPLARPGFDAAVAAAAGDEVVDDAAEHDESHMVASLLDLLLDWRRSDLHYLLCSVAGQVHDRLVQRGAWVSGRCLPSGSPFQRCCISHVFSKRLWYFRTAKASEQKLCERFFNLHVQMWLSMSLRVLDSLFQYILGLLDELAV